MNWQTVFNPFSKFSEKKLLLVGLLFFIINSLVSYFTKVQIDSIFHFTPNENLTIKTAFMYVTFSTVTAIVFLFLLALIFNKKTRFIDIANTILLSQAPNFIVMLTIKFIKIDTLAPSLKINNDTANHQVINSFDMVSLIIFILILLVIAVYGFVLLYNGFKTATNFKKWQHITLFVILLFAFILIHQVYIQYLDL